MALFKKNENEEANLDSVSEEELEQEAPQKITRKEKKEAKREAKQIIKEKEQAQKEMKQLRSHGLQNINNLMDLEHLKKILAQEEKLWSYNRRANETEFIAQMHAQNLMIIEQNFIIIRQLDRITTLLENKK